MNFLKKIIRPTGFRARLVLIVSLGILTLALTASLTTAWVTSNSAAEQMVGQGRQITETLARQSILALIYASPENASAPLETVMSFPGVIQAGIFTNDLRELAASGDAGHQLPTFSNEQLNQGNQLMIDSAQVWQFLTRVMSGGNRTGDNDEEFQFQLGNQISEQLGYAWVIMDKSALRTMQVNIFLNNTLIALSFAFILALLVNWGIDRLTRPLFALIGTIQEHEKDGTPFYADLKGPKEINDLIRVFNRLMANIKERDKKLREHGDRLEVEVDMRTRELVQAHDAALSASRHKAEFLTNITHELRTPLQAIIGYSELVREELDMACMDDSAREMDLVIRNANRLLEMITKILDMAKIDAGKMDINLKNIDLQQLFKDAEDTILPLLKQNQNSLETKISGLAEEIKIDREKLLQIILNLLGNATKFTQNGTICLTADLAEHRLRLEVQDSGIGMTDEQLNFIFEEFRQADGTTTRKFDGTGLGLAITKRLTELMGGKIEVQSEPGTGTCFTLLFPLPILITTPHVDSMAHQQVMV